MSTAVPPIQFTPTGLVVPQSSAVLAGVQVDIDNALGGGVNAALETPQGQLATSEAAIINDVNAQFALFVSQIDPDTADGFMQDAIARLYFLTRNPGLPTTVQVVCLGDQGVTIPLGMRVQDTSGNQYICVQSGSIGSGGTVTLQFENVVLGPIPCPANTVTTIVGPAPSGLDTINNPSPGAVGADVESRTAFEFRREQSVALNAHGSISAIGAAVFDVPDVIDVLPLENITNATVTGAIGGQPNPTAFPLVAHSIYIAVVGGAPQDIGNAIFSKKNDGSNMNGNTTVTVVDESVGVPFPTYPYTYEIPSNLAFKVAVQIQNNSGLPANIVALTQAAVVASFVGADGSARVRTGGLVLAGKFYAPVSAIGPSVNVVQILLGPVTATLTSYQAGIDQFPTLQASDVTVTLV
jgi:hypothetical protein